jgi:Domain of unknown function (DUF7008)
LLDRLEDRWFWFNDQGLPQPRSVAEMAVLVETAEQFSGFTDALDQWVDRRGEPTAKSLATLLEPEGVPYLAALRYKDSGLRKRAAQLPSRLTLTCGVPLLRFACSYPPRFVLLPQTLDHNPRASKGHPR